MNKSHEFYIQKCFDLALKGAGLVGANPLVGAVIVKNDQIIAEGFHRKWGEDHAELDAIKKANIDLAGTTLYCNLEPCCHEDKKTPPCAQRIIKEGIKTVVISNLDPNPKVSGKGIKLLQEAGIEVITGVLEKQGLELNEIFFYHIVNHKPFVHLKMAQTIDGKLASVTKDSKWITSEKSRTHVHQQRQMYDAILVGANTIREDNPSLTVRLPDAKDKAMTRFVLSKSGLLDPSANIFNDEFKEQTYVIIPENLDNDLPFQTVRCPLKKDKSFDLGVLVQKLYDEYKIRSLFVEGGQLVFTSFIQQHQYNKVSVYIAPKILGKGHETIGDLRFEKIADAISFDDFKWTTLGPDIVFTAIKRH